MSSVIIDGKAIAKKKRIEIKRKVEQLKIQGIIPGLAVILVGEDSASKTYVRNKQKACMETGIQSFLFEYEASVTETVLIEKIKELNDKEDVHGILVQLPLPKHINPKNIIQAISPDKDVDGFHPINIGKMVSGEDGFVPCTPLGIIHLLNEINYTIRGKHAVVVGRSNIVGKPMAQLLLNMDATVTICHSKTNQLENYTKNADLLICAVGKAKFLGKNHVKDGAVVIDVGMNRDETGKLCGDVDFNHVKDVASYITPVPGGVGPMTITMLLENVIKAAKNINKI
ncbi:bifunctional methylenetetrahydrofolate dehydrogenase/methenyltetrahydrofolate cyclohydrolase FolD [Bacillus kwashiorkori]|uniref:bifunctional methylenetetrahydrofolate dehydrogenase/methenyltetrahydrofolate cyclohydrolase FolD n=1 Tax=Bacillus kwashiorkori TaxID=1522318 RepID=UPI0007844132|nr:bifunctional methylenetetrahydrofolate dehydrogenase/methenyltetrahydrofolate cyclohydrolase FolD [Bacillus kwashiorkori]